jgi:diguanylate cyclase
MTMTRPQLLATPLVSLSRKEQLLFVRRIRGLRALGLALGFFCVAAVFYQNGAHPALWALLAIDGFLWPHAAYWLSYRSAAPQRRELLNLQIDSALGGVWIALMQFNLLPSALFLALLSMDKIAAGGTRLWARAAGAQALACLLAAALNGFRFAPATSMATILACLPFLTSYPIAVSTVTWGLARKVRSQNRLLEKLNRVDALTGLFNRGSWEIAADRELQRQKRSHQPLSVLMIDVDRFKAINDQYGHPVGDEVIRGIAGIMRECVRDIDIAGRYGGDEFAVLLPGTSLSGALLVGERIRQRVESGSFDFRARARCTVSIGAAEATPLTHDLRAWITEADAALYRAKAEGRNRTAQSSGHSGGSPLAA